MHTTVPEAQPQGSAPYFLMFGRQPHLPINVTPWSGSTDHHGAKYHQIHAENKGMHLVGS